jgi:pimeloyl-ACP methyl ester carboxylesterase
VDLASTFQDAEELVQYLCRRFHQPAVTLVAHDSGSVVAMRLAQQHPELVRSVFLVAPLIDFGRQHEALLAWALGKARRERQFPILAQLETTAGGRGGVALPLANATQLVKLRRAVADLGGDMRKGGFVLKLLHHAFAASEYSVGDKLTLVPCGIQSAAHQFNDLRQVNLTEQVRAVKVPVGMACGKWDRVTPCAVVEDYLRLLRSAASTASPAPTLGENDDAVAVAPSPETPAEQGAGDVIVFAKSAHWPFIEEGATFAERLREHLSANSNR